MAKAVTQVTPAEAKELLDSGLKYLDVRCARACESSIVRVHNICDAVWVLALCEQAYSCACDEAHARPINSPTLSLPSLCRYGKPPTRQLQKRTTLSCSV